MTTKEFRRRFVFYSSLEYAADLFNHVSKPLFVYKVSLRWYYSCTDFVYVPSVYTKLPFNDSFLVQCDSLYYDKFTREDFAIQLKYFHSFFNRCSNYQKSLIITSRQFVNLLLFIGIVSDSFTDVDL